jgi:CheY-like chemotaxis protein
MPRILVAEDERDIRELIGHALRYAGFEVVLVANGLEAVEAAKLEHPDLVILDVRMPKMTGYEACQQLKGDPATQSIPVIFLSAKGQESEIEEGIAAGAEAYILKPFGPEDLANQVKAVLQRAGL